MEVLNNGQVQLKDLLRLSLRLRKVLSQFSIRLDQYYILLLLHDDPGLTPRKFIQKISKKPSHITRAMNSLATAELIERRVGADRRTVPTYLTKKGTVLIK